MFTLRAVMLPEEESYQQKLETKVETLTRVYHEGILTGKTFEELYSIVQAIRVIQDEIKRCMQAVKNYNKHH